MVLWNVIFICTPLSLLRCTQATPEEQIRSTHRGIKEVPQSHQVHSEDAIGSKNRIQKRDLWHFDSELNHFIPQSLHPGASTEATENGFSELSHSIPQTFHPEASTEATENRLGDQRFLNSQHSGTRTPDLRLGHALSPTTEEWMSLLLPTDEPSPLFTPPAEAVISHESPPKLTSSNSIASSGLLITPPRPKRKFPFAIPVDDEDPEIVRQLDRKHQHFARKMTDAFIQSEASSYDMKSVAQAYFRAQEREDAKPGYRLPAEFFGDDFSHSASDPPRLMRALGEPNIDMMTLYAPVDFEGLMDTWTKQGLNSDGDFFKFLENGAEDDFARGMYSEPLVNEASSLSRFVSEVKRRLSGQIPLTYKYEVLIEMGKVTEFWSATKIFTESEALKAIEKLDKLVLSDPLTYLFAETWLNEFSEPPGRWHLKMEQLKELEAKAADRILQSIAYSTELKPRGVPGGKDFNAANAAGFDAKNAWKQLAKLPLDSKFRSKLLQALKEWDLLMEGTPLSLKHKVLLEAAVKYHSAVVTQEAFRRNDLTGADLALSIWVALHDSNLSKDTIKKTLEQRVPHLAQANRLLQQGASARLQLQSLVAIVFPWAYERYHALPTMGHENDFSVAASTFLIMRKRLNNVLQFSPEERNKFKTELIEFLGTENYDKRISQIIQISNEIRHAINMRNMRTLAEQERLEVAPHKHWYHYLRYLGKLQQKNPQSFKRLAQLFDAFPGVTKDTKTPFSVNQFYTYINHCAHSYIVELFHSAMRPETAAHLTYTNWKLFKAIEDANEHILALIQARFSSESDMRESYELTHDIRMKAAENYEGFLRWREKYDVLSRTMSDEFVDWIRKLDSQAISISDDRFEERGYPGYPMIAQSVRKAPPKYQLTRLLQSTLGLHFFSNRKYLIIHRRKQLGKSTAYEDLQSHIVV